MKSNAVGNLWQAEQTGVKLARERQVQALADLRKIPADDLVKGGGGPTIGTPVYPVNYPTALAHELASDVPTLTGMTWDDFGPPAKYDPYTTPELLRKRIARICPPDRLAEALAQYPATNNAQAREQWKLIGNQIRMADIFNWARERARTSSTPAYTYMFTQAQPFEPEKGAYHASDLNYEFDQVAVSKATWQEQDRAVAKQVSTYWANFVKTGNPNGPGLPSWPAFQSDAPATMYLGTNSAFAPIASPEAWKLLFQRNPAP